MALHNEDIGAALDEMADLPVVQGENACRIGAYRCGWLTNEHAPNARPVTKLRGLLRNTMH